MNTKQARELGSRITTMLLDDRPARAIALLAPILAERTPFARLDTIGQKIGEAPTDPVLAFLDQIAAEMSPGGWVVIGQALKCQWRDHPEATFARCRQFIIQAHVWHATDALAERVPGPALVDDFDTALPLLEAWQGDPDRWVRRAVGVAVHYWAKRSRGAPELIRQAASLLKLLEPMFTEWEMQAVKGIAWGLKTLGRNYPDLVADWLVQQVTKPNTRYRTHTLRKALLYLSEEQRALVLRSKPR